jgi:hypothetical protein
MDTNEVISIDNLNCFSSTVDFTSERNLNHAEGPYVIKYPLYVFNGKTAVYGQNSDSRNFLWKHSS